MNDFDQELADDTKKKKAEERMERRKKIKARNAAKKMSHSKPQEIFELPDIDFELNPEHAPKSVESRGIRRAKQTWWVFKKKYIFIM